MLDLKRAISCVFYHLCVTIILSQGGGDIQSILMGELKGVVISVFNCLARQIYVTFTLVHHNLCVSKPDGYDKENYGQKRAKVCRQ